MQRPGEPRVASCCLKVGSLGQLARAADAPQKPRPSGRLRARRRPRSIDLRLRARGGGGPGFRMAGARDHGGLR